MTIIEALARAIGALKIAAEMRAVQDAAEARAILDSLHRDLYEGRAEIQHSVRRGDAAVNTPEMGGGD